jgi:mRNA interferase RelE/StbE
MAWRVELSETADRELSKLDTKRARRILKFLNERVAKADDKRSLGEFWKYRVGDYRLICHIVDKRLVVLAQRVGHRREIYR